MRAMTKLAPMLVLAVIASCGRDGGKPAKPHRAEPGDVAVVGATAIPMDREGTLPGTTVLIRGDRIVAVAPDAEVDTTGATIVDGKGKWLLPGLADMHVHFWSKADLDLFLLQGVTTVRNLFGSPEHVRWRDAIARGERGGPTIVTAGPILDGDPPTWPGSDVVTTVDAARAAVRAQHAAGYDWLKVYNGLSAEVYDAILAEAKAVGMPVAGHVPGSVGIARAIGSGQRSIEHLEGYVPFFGEPVTDPALVDATARATLWNCPTLVVTDRFARLDDPASLAGTRGLELVSPMVRGAWDPKNDFRLQRFTPEMFASIREKNVRRRTLVGDLARAGAKLVLGTDTGNPYVVPGFAVADELALLVGAGLTPWQALRSATAAAAELQGTPGDFGVIAAGARADLILIVRDPLADVTAVIDPAVVIVRGTVHRHDELLAAARAGLAAPAGDRFAGMPAPEGEGTALVSARYDVVFRDQVIGGDRAVLSKTDGGTRVVRGQIVLEAPARTAATYRATADSVEMTGDDVPGGLTVTREGAKVRAVHGAAAAIERDAARTAVVAPQTIAEFFWYAERLADLQVGGARTIEAVEVMTEGGLRLDPARFDFTRQPDADGRRVYAMVGKHGNLDFTGTFSVDADGAPHEVSLTLRFGTFAMRRVE
jgi:imidazolonepropionase-like amidohydrolase